VRAQDMRSSSGERRKKDPGSLGFARDDTKTKMRDG
jgi:hypothetical protein